MKKIPVVIIANKQDIETSMSVPEIIKCMKLDKIENPYQVFSTCATSGAGLQNAFCHMTEIVKENRGLV